MGRYYSPEQQESLLAQIKAYEDKGSTLDEALKKVGISQTAYYNWRRKLKARNSQEKEVKQTDFYVDGYNRLLAHNTALQKRVSELESVLGKLLIENILKENR